MFLNLFRSNNKPQVQDEPEERIEEGQKFSIILNSLSQEEMVHLMLNLPAEQAIEMFFHLNREYQHHVFPLFSFDIVRKIFDKADETLQTELMSQMDGFMKYARLSEQDPFSSQSFFYKMANLNALKYQTQQKYVYVCQASSIVEFELNPYKYQRKLLETHVQQIIKGIRESKMMYHPIILACSKSANQLTILDGQHRWNALKRIDDKELLSQIIVQFDVILFEGENDTDDDVMQMYQNINTNVPIDPNRLAEELRYVALVESIKTEFSKAKGESSIRPYTKGLKDIPQQYVIDTYLKEELQYRQTLSKFSEQEIMLKLKLVNEYIKRDSKLMFDLSMIESRVCKRDNFYLGVQWPLAIEMLEKMN